MFENEKNVTNLYEIDENFISDLMKFSVDKKLLIKGFVLGLKAQEKQIVQLANS